MSRRAVVTGCGLVSALGSASADLHRALCAGRSGIGEIELFDASGLGCTLGGEIRGFNPRDYLGKKNFRPLDRTSRLVTSAVALALDDAGWTPEARGDAEIGLVLGTMYCSVRTIAEFDRRAMEAGPIYASPLDFANSVINAAAGQAAIWHDLRGINSTIATGQTSGLRAISYAASLIESGRADVLLVGGAEELCLESCLGFDRLGALCGTGDGADPQPVPFAASRNGFVLGEGAALLVLESEESATRRGREVLARISGCGSGFDASRGQEPVQAQAATVRALRLALEDAGMAADGIGAVSASANGGEMDELEARALGEVFAERAEALPVTALKGALGETLGASGGLQAVAALETLRTGELPAIHGLEQPVQVSSRLELATRVREVDRRTVLLNSVGIDGHRCAVVVTADGGSRARA